MAAAAWRRPWRSRISFSSSTAHGGGNTGDDDGCSLQPAASSGNTTTYSTTTGSRSTTGTTISGSFIILPPPAPAPVMEVHSDSEVDEEEKMKKLKYVEALVVRFPEDKSAPERWLSELEVAWILHLAHISDFAGRNKFMSGQLLYLARSWIMALFEITRSISAYFDHSTSNIKEEDTGPPASEFLRFFEATLSKMLPFVDAIIVAVRTYDRWGLVESADEKLQALLLLRDALSTASVQIHTRDLLPAEPLMAKLDEAIWDTMKETKAGFLSFSSSRGVTLAPGSSHIHPITRSFVSYIKVLWANYGLAYRILYHGESVPEHDNETAIDHLTRATREMVHSLEQMLTVPRNKSLEFLFTINNLHYIHQQMKQLCPLAFPTPELPAKIDDCINSYIQLSWAPLLKCLYNPTTPRCCFSRNSPLQNFESNFQITYNAQKYWKVPDPGIRGRLREAIIQEIIPVFTEFLTDNTRSTPRISPQEMKKMLQELFEG